jgi:hypothetical protein
VYTPNTPQRVVLVIAAVAVLALAFYPPFSPRHIRSGRFDIEIAAVTLATIGLLLALRGLPKLSFHWRLPDASLASAGWKRLWVVLSLLYLAAVIGYAWTLYPTSPSEDARRAAATKDPWHLMDTALERARVMPPRTRSVYDETLREHHEREQRIFLMKAAFWWVCPVVVVYLLGMAWCWIYRGFQIGSGIDSTQ